jgi:hypothetical protein
MRLTRGIVVATCMAAVFGLPAAAVAGEWAAGPHTSSPILEAVKRNRGLCCKVTPIRLKKVVVSADGRFARATTAGGNALEQATVILWRGVPRWAVVEYGTDVTGCGFIPRSVIVDFFSEMVARACTSEIQSDPFFRGGDPAKVRRAAEGDSWLADHGRGERLVDLLSMTISKRDGFAEVVASVQTRVGRATRFGLLRRGTAMWSLIDVTSQQERLGCGLLRNEERRALRLPQGCGG